MASGGCVSPTSQVSGGVEDLEEEGSVPMELQSESGSPARD